MTIRFRPRPARPGSTTTARASIVDSRYVSLTTFRRDGAPVATPVWLAVQDGHGFVVTLTGSGKFKRLRRNPRVSVAPCDRRGHVTGPAWAGTVRVLDGPDAHVARAALVAQFGWQARLLDVVRRLRRGQAAYLELELDPHLAGPQAPDRRSGDPSSRG
jgi:PPOX class probable F420-dependent enzyme